MATKGYIGILREQAMKRIQASAALIEDAFGIAPPILPANRDLDYQEATRLDALANWLESLSTALTSKKAPARKKSSNEPQVQNYEDLTVKELRALADTRGIDHSAIQLKADLIAVLQGPSPVVETEENTDANLAPEG